MEKNKVMTRGYDLASTPMYRIFRHYCLSRFIPLGDNGGGAGLRCLLVLGLLHLGGRPLFWFSMRYERHLNRVYRMKQKVQRLITRK